ncbi:MAG: NigD-like protein [Prevotella sp.]|jgi:hypothetical protein
MKKIKLASVLFAALLCVPVLQSCDDDDDFYYDSSYYPSALVTAKTAGDSTFYLQLDDNTTLLPTNLKTSPFGGKEVRALVSYTASNDLVHPYDQAVHVNWIDSILTKNTVPSLGDDNDEKYGDDRLEVVRDWVTIAEDGYLTLRFRTVWGGGTHYINLVRNMNTENPYELELRHDANGDLYGYWGDALVAFNLKDLPDTEGKTVKLTVRWKSYSGEKTAEFDYCTRTQTEVGNLLHGNTEFVTTVK